MDRSAAMAHFTGPLSSLKTPFCRDGSVDHDGLRRMIDRVIAHGTGVVILTAGDSHLICLSDDEIEAVSRTTCEHVAGRVPVIAADRFHSTARAVDFARYARSVGADMVMALPPDWAASCTPATLAEHYASVSAEAPVVLVTNLLGAHGTAFALETIERVVQRCPGVVAIKDDLCGDFARQLCLLADEQLAVFAGGRKVNHMNMWPYGCTGYMSTYQMLVDSIPKRYWKAIEAGDTQTARTIIRDYDIPLFHMLESFTGGWNAALHGCLEVFGVAGRWRRLPYHSLGDADLERLAGFFQNRGLLI